MTNGGGGTGVVVADAPTEEAPAMEAADVEEAADVIESKEEKEIRAANKNQMKKTAQMTIRKAPRMYVRKRIRAEGVCLYRLKSGELQEQ